MELARPKGAVVNCLLSSREGGSPTQEGNPLQKQGFACKNRVFPMG
jgi:hypothetical protein